MDENIQWFLMKHDDASVFGPVPFDQLRQWAEDAQISPLDKVSQDETTWVKAPMIPELGMDYLVEVSTDQYYGPTTLGAVREFLLIGEINTDTFLTNCTDGFQQRVSDFPELQPPKREEEQPVRTSIRLSLQKRIRELEETLMEERRARETAELRCERLEARLAENSAKNY
jgi:hypothetical protein